MLMHECFSLLFLLSFTLSLSALIILQKFVKLDPTLPVLVITVPSSVPVFQLLGDTYCDCVPLLPNQANKKTKKETGMDFIHCF